MDSGGASDASPVRPGEVLAGRYRVERVLGVGGMGVVVAARHLQLDELVAIKFLLRSALENPDAMARFAREARAAVKIKNEHVARVLDVATLENGAPYMVMEYLQGTDLRGVLSRRGALALDEAADYILQSCEAIAEAHSLGIVHRDLKPENLFLIQRPDGAPAIKVLDFGISKTSGMSGSDAALTRHQAVLGSPLYMSPEQLASSRDVDARTDIWSLGVVLYELLTGRGPFEADTLPQLCMMITHQAHLPLLHSRPDLPPQLEAFITCCLEKDRQRRFANIGEFATALADFAPPHCRLSVERIRFLIKATRSDPQSMASYYQAAAGVGAQGRVPTDGHSSSGGHPLSAARSVTTTGGGQRRSEHGDWANAERSPRETTSGGSRSLVLAIVLGAVGALVVVGLVFGAVLLNQRNRTDNPAHASDRPPPAATSNLPIKPTTETPPTVTAAPREHTDAPPVTEQPSSSAVSAVSAAAAGSASAPKDLVHGTRPGARPGIKPQGTPPNPPVRPVSTSPIEPPKSDPPKTVEPPKPPPKPADPDWDPDRH